MLVATLIRVYPVFRERNFRLFFYGQIISFMGTWLQITTEGWLVLKLTNSPMWVGLISCLMLLPSFILAPIGGAIVDQFDKRKVLFATSISSMIQALVLGVLTLTGWVTIGHVTVLAFLLGVITSVDAPARRAFIGDIVQEDDLHGAIGFNTFLVMLAQAIGSGLAGFAILAIGIGGTFILNGVSYLAVVITLVLMHLAPRVKPLGNGSLWQMTVEAGRYTFRSKRLRPLILFSLATATFGFSCRPIIPVITDALFYSDPRVLGYLSAALALGAVIGALFQASSWGRNLSFRRAIGGGIGIGAIMVLLSWSDSLFFNLTYLAVLGVTFTVTSNSIQTTLQRIVMEEERGMLARVLGFAIALYLGGMAVGNFGIGLLAQHWGHGVALRSEGVVLLIVGIFFLFRRV